MLSRIILASAAMLAFAAPAAAQDRMAPNAQLFSATNYQGRSLTVVRDMPVIPATWSARSIRMGGGSSWEVCELPNFRGRCTVLTGSSANLQAQLGVSGVRSIRAAAVPTPLPQPVPGGGGRSLKVSLTHPLMKIAALLLETIQFAPLCGNALTRHRRRQIKKEG